MLVLLAWRNFLRHLHRFQVILGALLLGFAALTVMIAVTSGMAQSLREKAARYFSGDLLVFSFREDRRILNEAAVHEALVKLPGVESLTRRTEYYKPDSTVFFAGSSVRLRKLTGIDWAVERPAFLTLDWREGQPPAVGDGQGVVLSAAVADRLGLRLGDGVTLTFQTLRRQTNSLNLVVRGVFYDTSLFGYAAYIDIEALNLAVGHPKGSVTAMGVMLKTETSSDALAPALVGLLRESVPTHDLITDRDTLNRVMGKLPKERPLGVMTLNANLADIQDILNALLAVTWVASGLFLAILMVGVGNTYRMILFERTQEIGTMRALGASRGRLLLLLLAEAGWLGLAGLVLGGGLGVFVSQAAGLLDWSSNGMALMFLQNGRLSPRFVPLPLACAGAALVLTTMLGALVPAWTAVKMRPVDALREGE